MLGRLGVVGRHQVFKHLDPSMWRWVSYEEFSSSWVQKCYDEVARNPRSFFFAAKATFDPSNNYQFKDTARQGQELGEFLGCGNPMQKATPVRWHPFGQSMTCRHPRRHRPTFLSCKVMMCLLNPPFVNKGSQFLLVTLHWLNCWNMLNQLFGLEDCWWSLVVVG